MKQQLHLVTLLGATLIAQTTLAQTISFQEAPASTGTFKTFSTGSCKTVDIDQDGDMDIFVLGYNGTQDEAALYINDGAGNFTEQILSNVLGLSYSSCDLTDINGDGTPDLVITGRNGIGSNATKVSIVYKYVNGSFVNIHNFSPGVEGGASKFIDYNNDGMPGLIYTGFDGYQNTLKFYKNTNGVLSVVNYPGINTKYREGAEIAVGDLNNDGYLDLIICGTNHSSNSTRSTDVYLNSQDGTFGEYSLGNLPAFYEAGIALGDVDGNGTLDAFILGLGGSTRLFLNDGTGSFTASSINFNNASHGKAQMADLDNDGDLDIVYNGSNNFFIYQNDGVGNFTSVSHTLPGSNRGNLAIADFDGDGLLDIYQCGTASVRYLKNTSCVISTSNLYNIVANCDVHDLFSSPVTAEDCEGNEFTGSTTQTLPIVAQGTTQVTWTFTNGTTTFTRTQLVTIEEMNTTVLQTTDALTAELSNATYQWIDCATNEDIPGATSQSFQPTTAGTYKVRITTEGCTDVSDCIQVSNLGLNEATSISVSIYPNPSAEGRYTVQASGIVSNYSVLDINGKELESATPNSNVFNVNLATAPTGIYFIKLQTENEVQTFKLMK